MSEYKTFFCIFKSWPKIFTAQKLKFFFSFLTVNHRNQNGTTYNASHTKPHSSNSTSSNSSSGSNKDNHHHQNEAAARKTFNSVMKYHLIPQATSQVGRPYNYIARAHLFKMQIPLHHALRHSEWDKASSEIWLRYRSNQQTERLFKEKVYLWDGLTRALEVTFFISFLSWFS